MSIEEEYKEEIKWSLDTSLNPLQVTITYLPSDNIFLLKIYDPRDTKSLDTVTEWIKENTIQVGGSTYQFKIVDILETPSKISCKWVCEIELTEIDP